MQILVHRHRPRTIPILTKVTLKITLTSNKITLTKTLSRFMGLGIGFLGFCFSTFADLPIREGLQYRKIITPQSQTVHILEINPNKFTILPQHAKGKAVGLDTLTSLAKEHAAIAAINGGFFHASDGKEGLPAGILKIKGLWYGIAYTNRGAVGWWENKPTVLMSRLQTKTMLKINQHRFPIHVMNRPGSSDRAVLYTEAFGKYSDSAPGGTDIIIQSNRILDIVPSGETEIPKNGYVYSMGSQSQRPFYKPKKQDKVQLTVQVIPELQRKNKGKDKGIDKNKDKSPAELWQTVENIVGGTPLLIENGQVVLEASHKRMQSDFASKPRARTAFGVLKNGSWVWAVVEKNQETNSIGMTMLELANFMQGLGCLQALNLDGGGSSAMYLEDKIVSASEDGKSEETPLAVPLIRPIADALLILEKKEKNSIPQ